LPTAPHYDDHLNLMVYRDENGQEHPVQSLDDWELRRAHILANMQLVMGELPGEDRRVPLDIEIHETVELPAYTRQKISFASEPGDRVPAYLLIPHGIPGKGPAMLCLHQTTIHGKAEPAGIDGKPNLNYAAHLAERGYVTLAPDYGLGVHFPNHGEYQIDPYAMGYASATMKGIWNHMRAVDVLETLPQVDSARIGCIGHSLGGHNTLFVGAFDQRLKVLVSSCGYNSFLKYEGGDLTGWSHTGYMPRIADAYDKDATKLPFDFTEIVGTLAPRPFFTNATLQDEFSIEGVHDCIAAATPVYELYGAGDKLAAIYPDCGHDFPLEAREAAYNWIDRWLKEDWHRYH